MKNIFLKQLILKNFKGIKDLTVDFGKATNISGENATGKTSIFDAFTWLLFGKDSHDLAKFDIQPLDDSGKVIDNIETEVTGMFNIGGVQTILRKVYKQKWVRKRGAEKAEKSNNTVDYYINEVPQKENEYQQKTSEIIPENIFKLLTNPLYFSLILPWKDRRKIIFDINGDVSQEDVINYSDKLADLNKLLNPNESMEDFEKRIKAGIIKLEKDQKDIPVRVDERHKSIKVFDFETLDFNRRGVVAGLRSIDEQLIDSSKGDEELLKEKDRLYSLKGKLKDMEWEIKKDADKPLQELREKLQGAEQQLRLYKSQDNLIKSQIESKRQTIVQKEKLKEELKNRWHEENDKTFEMPGNLQVCPTCHRPFETDDVETKRAELEGNFNENKARILKGITIDGQGLNKAIEKLTDEIVILEVDLSNDDAKQQEELIEDLKKQITDFVPNTSVEGNLDYQQLWKETKDLETKLSQPQGINDKKRELLDRKSDLQKELEELNSKLKYKELNKGFEERIEELNKKKKEIGQLIADLEKAQNLSNEFIRTKVELIESSVNSKFKFVKIRLFKDLISGGLEENCEVMVNGVPFSTNLNSGMKINAGIDIINTLSQYYDIEAPIFADNAEGVTKLIPVNTQLIKLVVPPSFEILDSRTKAMWIEKYKTYEAAKAEYELQSKVLKVEVE